MKEDNNIKSLIASILKLSLKLSKSNASNASYASYASVKDCPKPKPTTKPKATPKPKSATKPKAATKRVGKKIVGGGSAEFFE
jgi:hypothetical protein